jgi:GT2 family glycosyltransferase
VAPEIGDVRRQESIRLAHPLPSLAPEPAGPATDPTGFVSIVVPCCGQLEYTRLCVPSLLRHSRRPFELIFLDVGSLDGTPEYLDGLAAAAPVRVEVVHSPSESGFHAACLEALARARSEFVVWLNNDTVVTEGWLQQLVALAGVAEVVGMVGPMSNYAPAQQRVAPIPYRIRSRRSGRPPGAGPAADSVVDLAALDRFASQWRDEHKGQWFEVDRLGGFCLLIKRAVLQTVPLFDEKSDPGVFDADRLCWQVRQAGFRCVCCRDLFIHHFGSRVAST